MHLVRQFIGSLPIDNTKYENQCPLETNKLYGRSYRYRYMLADQTKITKAHHIYRVLKVLGKNNMQWKTLPRKFGNGAGFIYIIVKCVNNSTCCVMVYYATSIVNELLREEQINAATYL